GRRGRVGRALRRSGRPAAPDARHAEPPAGAGRRGAPRLRDHAGGEGEDRREGAPRAGHALRGDQTPQGGRRDRGVRGEARPRRSPGRRAATLLLPHRLRRRGPGGGGREARRPGARRAPEGRLPRAEAEPGGGV
ncbi:MAG: Transcriptional regulator, PadR family, partial [uncultured Rubrobacteraceae bacterium]